MTTLPLRRLLALGLLALALLVSLDFVASAHAATTLDLETLSGSEEEQMLQEGKVNSVELVKAYLARIAALNKAGPGLNAVTQTNPDVLVEAEEIDKERAEGKDLGPAMGLPILLKDIIDATPMYTSAGDWALRESFPEKDSGVAKELRAHGVIVLGKTGLSEWANSFGSQPSGFGNLTGQVLNANDAAQGPSGSSSGSGAAAAAALASLTIGTETNGSIISPSTSENVVGLRPTLGLVPGYGIAPISASQDTAGPIVRTVADAAITLQSIAEVPGTDPEANEEYDEIMGPEFFTNGDLQQPPFTELPNYMSALSMEFVRGKRIGYNNTGNTEAITKAKEALEAAGAIIVPDAETSVSGTVPAVPSHYEEHATIDAYYKHLGPNAPVKSLQQETEVDATDPQEALKYGNKEHTVEAAAEDTPGGANQKAYDEALPKKKKLYHEAIEKMMNEPSGGGGPVIAVLGAVRYGPEAGDPEITVSMGYSATQRRSTNIDISGGPFDEVNLLGVAYVIEQSTHLHEPPSMIDPAMYRCAHTVPAPPFASRGHCNPEYDSIMSLLGGTPTVLPFSLEGTSATRLEAMMRAGTLTSEELVRAELYRIAITNANGPSIQAIRDINPNAIEEAIASDQRRASGAEGPLAGIPVLVDDSIDATGMPTSGGSIALEDDLPASDAAVVKELRQAGAVILGDTNTTELGDEFGANMPQGYSSLGGQVLLPSDTNKSVGGSSGGSAAAVSVGLAPLAIGMEASTESAQMIAPAGNAGLVALKPTVGLVSSEGIMPVADSQDAAGPIGQTVTDVATALGALSGQSLTTYTSGLSAAALSGKKIVALTGTGTTTAPYPEAKTEVAALGATVTERPPPTGTTVPSVIPYEFHKDLDSFLAGMPGSSPKSLAQVIEYNNDNPVEGLKYEQLGLAAAEAVQYENPTTTATYEANLELGREQDQEAIEDLLTGGYSAIMVPSGSALVGIADRAGYPVLTIPAGYGAENSSTGGDPTSIDLIGAADSEAALLDDGYAFEQAVNVRVAGPEYMRSSPNPTFSGVPSETNQSMWRCVAGSSFFKPYECNPGDLLSTFCMDGTQASCQTPPAEIPPTGGGGGGGGGGTAGGTGPNGGNPSGGGGVTTSTHPGLKVGKITAGHGLISIALSCPSAGLCSNVTIKAVIVEELEGKKLIATTAKRSRTIRKTVTVASATTSVAAGKTKTVRLKLDKTGLSLLQASKHGLGVKLTISSSGKTVKSKVLTVEKLPEAKRQAAKKKK